MRDVLGTIQADQDAIIRAGSRGALVVDGGPGTGKTVVALHRAAYLLYADPRLGHRRGGVLFVGPHQPYLAYVADVLPSLGEEGVQTCTLRDLRRRGRDAPARARPGGGAAEVVRAAMVEAIEPAVALYEEPPTRGHGGRDPVGRRLAQRRRLGRGVRLAEPGTPHNEAPRPGLGGAAHDPGRQARRRRRRRRRPDRPASAGRWRRNAGAGATAFDRAWPLIEATDLVGDLWSVPGLPAPVRAVARPGRGAAAAAPRTRRPGPCPTCRCSTPRGSGSATRRRRVASAGARPPWPPSARRWPGSSTT